MTVTIIKADDEQEQNNITKYRNSQNSVRGKDLVSLMDFHKSIKSQLKNCGYFYEIQAGSFDTKSKSKCNWIYLSLESSSVSEIPDLKS